MFQKWTLTSANVSGIIKKIIQRLIRRFFQNLLIEKEPTLKVLSKTKNRTTLVSLPWSGEPTNKPEKTKKNGYGYSPSCVKKEVLRAASKLFLQHVLDKMIVEDDLLQEEEEEEEDLSFIYETLQSPNFVAELEWVSEWVSEMAFSGLRGLASMKLKDVPSFVKSSVTRENMTKQTWGFVYNYNEKYVKTGSIRPLNDVMISVFFLSYAVGWPTEIRHLRHAEEAAKHTNKNGGEKKHH